MELFRQELYKVFTRKAALLAALFMVALAVFSGAAQVSSWTVLGNIRSYYSESFSPDGKVVTAAEAAKADKDFAQYARRNLFAPSPLLTVNQNRACYYDMLASTAYYQPLKLRGELAQNSTDMAKLAAKDGKNNYNYRNLALQTSRMEKLPTTPRLYFTLPWGDTLLFPNTLGCILVFVLVLLGIAPIFSEEYSSGMDSIILSSRNGRRKVVGAKIFAGIVWCVAAEVLFTLVDFAVQTIGYGGVYGWNAPLSALGAYSASLLNLNVLPYFLLQTLMSAIGVVFFGLLVLLISSLSRNVLVPFFVGGAVFAVPMFIETTFRNGVPAWALKLADYSYAKLMGPSDMLTGWRTLNLFGYPVYYSVALPVFLGLLSVAVVLLTRRVFALRQVG